MGPLGLCSEVVLLMLLGGRNEASSDEPITSTPRKTRHFHSRWAFICRRIPHHGGAHIALHRSEKNRGRCMHRETGWVLENQGWSTTVQAAKALVPKAYSARDLAGSQPHPIIEAERVITNSTSSIIPNSHVRRQKLCCLDAAGAAHPGSSPFRLLPRPLRARERRSRRKLLPATWLEDSTMSPNRLPMPLESAC